MASRPTKAFTSPDRQINEPEPVQLERTPGGGVNGLTPYARAGGNSYNAGGTGRSRTAPLPRRRK